MFKDHFSHASNHYRRYRPGYPAELFTWLASLPGNRHCAWDCATGNGQAATGLARHFRHVVGTDASQKQVRDAEARENISYAVCLAEEPPFRTGSLDMIAVAQAAHWFDLRRFYEVGRRVLKPGGRIALWTYGLCRISPETDEKLDEVYTALLGPFWPPERKLVDENYATIAFPFKEMEAPAFFITECWSFEHFIRYMATWSAVGEYRRATGKDPLSVIAGNISSVWPASGEPREIRWPIHIRVGVSPGSGRII